MEVPWGQIPVPSVSTMPLFLTRFNLFLKCSCLLTEMLFMLLCSGLILLLFLGELIIYILKSSQFEFLIENINDY